jgi:hypothetical protein
VFDRSSKPVNVAGTGYGRATLRAEAAEVESTAPGGRNHRLFLAAAHCGELVAAGLLSESHVVARLRAAAIAAGLTEHETERTVGSGLRHGMAQPRGVAS